MVSSVWVNRIIGEFAARHGFPLCGSLAGVAELLYCTLISWPSSKVQTVVAEFEFASCANTKGKYDHNIATTIASTRIVDPPARQAEIENLRGLRRIR
jgi:hypothetical protein